MLLFILHASISVRFVMEDSEMRYFRLIGVVVA